MTNLLTKNGKISIIMGIYNCASTLPEAIDSIINQTYTNWELIMCDDASTDNTFEVAKKYQEKYPDKIIVIQNEKNSRLAYSLNHCLKYATGEYVARMDGDDISTPDRFEKQIKFLHNNPDVDMVGTQMQHFSEKGISNIVKVPSRPDKYILRHEQPFIHATILTYKRVYDELEGYTVAERTNRAQDYDLWFKFYAKGFVADNIHEPLYLMREDVAAFKRRTFKVRWNAFKTTRIGFKMLNYPKYWIIKPAVTMIIKSIVPFRLVMLFRKWQKKND